MCLTAIKARFSILLLGAFIFSATSFGKTIHVDINAPAAGDGVYWSTAFTDLQDALAIAVNGDMILVAEGTYLPTPSGVRTISFNLVSGVTYLGGFTSTDTLLSQRNWITNKVILSGDLAGNGSNASNNIDNSHSVIYTTASDASLIFDGFHIIGGNADNDCFTGPSTARSGGGWFNDGSFTGGSSTPTIKNCKFVSNFAGCSGGGMFNDGNSSGNASPSFENVSFEGNFASEAGGAIYNNGNAGNASTSFINCKFMGNGVDTTMASATYGGALYNFGKSGIANATLINCLVSNNYSFAGGGMYNLGSTSGSASPSLINCTFYNNVAMQNGGACYVNAGDAGDMGVSIATIRNTIFDANHAGPFGGDVFRNNNGSVVIDYSLADVNDCSEIAAGDPATCNLGMIYNIDPVFTNPGDEDFTPADGSPAINQGLNGINGTTVDIVGNPRVQQSSIDMGAFESPFGPLPVELIQFEATLLEGEVAIDWVTAFEIDNDYFEVLRSNDGVRFESIGMIKGSETSNQYHQYRLIDKAPLPGLNYYKLKIVDFSRNVDFSPVRSIHVNEAFVTVFPNPAFEELFISVRGTVKGKAKYYIYNLFGLQLQSGSIQINESLETTPISLLEELDAGPYIIYVDFGTQQNQAFRFIKSRD
ncbi:MAG: DUF5123 domain-containing protein [Saprospiraceae bacterium]|nr:DUF5123 domain-containing protein [Saprospiraceae bacterium]